MLPLPPVAARGVAEPESGAGRVREGVAERVRADGEVEGESERLLLALRERLLLALRVAAVALGEAAAALPLAEGETEAPSD